MKIKKIYCLIALLNTTLFLCACSKQPDNRMLDNNRNNSDNINNSINTPKGNTKIDSETSLTDADETESSNKNNAKEKTSSDSAGETSSDIIQDKILYIIGNRVRIRMLPSTSADIHSHLNYGEEVILLESEGEWIKVKEY